MGAPAQRIDTASLGGAAFSFHSSLAFSFFRLGRFEWALACAVLREAASLFRDIKRNTHLAPYCIPPRCLTIPFNSIIVSTALTVEGGRPLLFVSSSTC